MCLRIGRSPISTIGLGSSSVRSARRVPKPPARMITLHGPNDAWLVGCWALVLVRGEGMLSNRSGRERNICAADGIRPPKIGGCADEQTENATVHADRAPCR